MLCSLNHSPLKTMQTVPLESYRETRRNCRQGIRDARKYPNTLWTYRFLFLCAFLRSRNGHFGTSRGFSR